MWLMRKGKAIYRYFLIRSLKQKGIVLFIAAGAFAASLWILPTIGTEFIPTLEEGTILVGVTMAPSISLEKATETVMKLEKEIMKHDQVAETISRIGRPEAGSHPHPVNYAEIHAELKPFSDESTFKNKQELVGVLRKELSSYPGVQVNFTQPVQNALMNSSQGLRHR